MTDPAPDPAIVRGWLTARSLARGLPAPVADSGGWRVDTDGEVERRRYLFAADGPGLWHLAATIDRHRVFLKLCTDAKTFAALLGPRWAITDANCMMVSDAPPPPERALPPGYAMRLAALPDATHVTIHGPDGDLAASGYAAEGDGVFVYDRIVTDEAHRRRGLGRAVMAALGATRRDPGTRQVLTATAMGAALYRTIGWRVYCPYTSAALR